MHTFKLIHVKITFVRDQLACDMYNTFAVLSESFVGSTANLLREIPHILSCFRRATHTPDRTKYWPTSLVEKPQQEFYFCEAQRIILVEVSLASYQHDQVFCAH